MKFAQKLALVLAGLAVVVASAPATAGLIYEARPHIVTQGGPGLNPADHLTAANEYTGVGDLIINNASRCSASRISATRILTAAHCVTDGNGNISLASANITFTTPGGTETHQVDAGLVNVHPDWNGGLLDGNDVAVLELLTTPSAAVETYGLFTGADVGAEVTKVGYGRSGVGATGATLSSGSKRDGRNLYDTDGNILSVLGTFLDLDSILLADFDNGLAANDAFGLFFGINNTGFFDEVNTAPGDSGGPGFINGLIAGVTSFGLRLAFTNGTTADIDGALNSSFGEFFGDARISDEGILAFLRPFLGGEVQIPEPSALVLLVIGLGLLGLGRRRRMRH